MLNKTIKILLLFVVVIGLSAGISTIFFKSYFSSLARKTVTLSHVVVEIPYGSSLKTVVKLLAEKKVVPNEQSFYWYMRFARNDAEKVQAGYYQFDGIYSLAQLAESLKNGRDRAFQIVFREGETLVDLVHSLEAAGVVSEADFIAAMTSRDVLSLIDVPLGERKALRNDVGGIEGYLFPDTYFFTKKDSAKSIILIMYRHLLNKIDEPMRRRMKEVGMNLHQVLTLAAIVEKETGAEVERPIIASVYLNRLKKRMRLQADPTVIYGIKDYKGKISKSDLLSIHPYNTYKIDGLPPGPISSVGIEAIKSVLWPTESSYLYFVSKNDGSHVFCEDLSCHNKAVKKWQIDFFKTAQNR